MAVDDLDDLEAFVSERAARVRPLSKCRVCGLPPDLRDVVERARKERGHSYAALADYVRSKGHALDDNRVQYHFTACRGYRGRAA